VWYGYGKENDMKIIIVGLGRTGCSLIEELSGENYDITVIEKRKDLVDEVTDRYSVNGVVGSGASKETLLKAGADSADALIALTPTDEINLLSCMQAKAVGTRRTAARLFLPDFVAERDQLKKEHNIDYMIKPKYDIAEEITRNIGLPGTVRMEGYFDNVMQIVTISVTEDSPLAGKKLMNLRNDIGVDVLVSTVIRDDKLYVPDGTFEIHAGDRIGVVAKRNEMYETLRRLGILRSKAKKILIAGSNIITGYLIDMLLAEKKNITVLEEDIVKCRDLMDKYPGVNVLCAEGDVTEVLEDEKVEKTDVVVALTDSDETNLVTSMYAWSRDVPSIITKVEAPGHVKLLHKVNMDITLSPSEFSVVKLVRFVRNYEVGDAKNDIGKYYMIADNKAEVLEFVANSDFAKAGTEFMSKEFRLKKDVIIAAVIREGELIIPGGHSSINVGDKVVVVSSKKNHIKKLDEIFVS